MPDDAWRRKLDPYSKRALEAAPTDGPIDITVRLKDRKTPARDVLTEAGLEVHATIGDIVVGRVSERSVLQRIAELPCVAEIQASRSLYPEKE